MAAQSNRAQQVAADIAELKTDVKYIRESLPRLDALADLVARHDERIASLEDDEEKRRSLSDRCTTADKSGWWSAKVAVISAITTALFTFIRAMIEHFIWKPHP